MKIYKKKINVFKFSRKERYINLLNFSVNKCFNTWNFIKICCCKNITVCIKKEALAKIYESLLKRNGVKLFEKFLKLNISKV